MRIDMSEKQSASYTLADMRQIMEAAGSWDELIASLRAPASIALSHLLYLSSLIENYIDETKATVECNYALLKDLEDACYAWEGLRAYESGARLSKAAGMSFAEKKKDYKRSFEFGASYGVLSIATAFEQIGRLNLQANNLPPAPVLQNIKSIWGEAGEHIARLRKSLGAPAGRLVLAELRRDFGSYEYSSVVKFFKGVPTTQVMREFRLAKPKGDRFRNWTSMADSFEKEKRLSSAYLAYALAKAIKSMIPLDGNAEMSRVEPILAQDIVATTSAVAGNWATSLGASMLAQMNQPFLQQQDLAENLALTFGYPAYGFLLGQCYDICVLGAIRPGDPGHDRALEGSKVVHANDLQNALTLLQIAASEQDIENKVRGTLRREVGPTEFPALRRAFAGARFYMTNPGSAPEHRLH
jgi:hypothetical protein